MPRKTNRMQGVQVVHVARRREQLVSASPAPAIVGKSLPTNGHDHDEMVAPMAVVSEPADPVPATSVPTSESCPAEPVSPSVVVDKAGFVTHIKGRRIF